MTKFPFYDGLADKSNEINNKDLSNKKSDIKNSEKYKGGFWCPNLTIKSGKRKKRKWIRKFSQKFN